MDILDKERAELEAQVCSETQGALTDKVKGALTHAECEVEGRSEVEGSHSCPHESGQE